MRFSDLVHKIIVQLQNQQYSILAKSDLYNISNLNDYQFAPMTPQQAQLIA